MCINVEKPKMLLLPTQKAQTPMCTTGKSLQREKFIPRLWIQTRRRRRWERRILTTRPPGRELCIVPNVTVVILMFHLLSLTQHDTLSVGFWLIRGFVLMLTCGLGYLYGIIVIRWLWHLFRHRDALNVAVPVGVPFVSHRLGLCQNSFTIAEACWWCGFVVSVVELMSVWLIILT